MAGFSKSRAQNISLAHKITKSFFAKILIFPVALQSVTKGITKFGKRRQQSSNGVELKVRQN